MTGGACRPAPRVVAVDGLPGSGKTSVVARLLASFPATGVARSTVLSPQMDDILRDMADVPARDIPARGQVIPLGFVRTARIMDAVMQFRYLADEFAAADWLLVDGWLLQVDASGAEVGRHEDWLRQFAAQLPVPDPLFYLRASPEACCERLVRQGHWRLRQRGASRMLSDLRCAYARYEEAAAAAGCVVIDAELPLEDVIGAIVSQLAQATELTGWPR